MADETERADVATVAYRMARELWVLETGNKPKASDVNFLKLVAICAMALKGGNPGQVHGWASEIYG